MHTQIILYYILAINLLAFIAYGHDKWKSQHQHPRTSIIIDTTGTLGRLNWNYRNITEVHTSGGKIEWIRSYEADEVIDRFEWVIDAVDTLDVRSLMVC